MISIDNNVWIFLGEEKKLSWDDRLQIAVDISHGIEYLHEGVCMFPDTFSLVVCENMFLTNMNVHETGSSTCHTSWFEVSQHIARWLYES
jgi:hypothetical protein